MSFISATCNPPCENGVCVSNNNCSCTDGYVGATCSVQGWHNGEILCSELVFNFFYTVVNECDINPCENEGSCSLVGRSYICHCANGYYGSFCQHSPPIGELQV